MQLLKNTLFTLITFLIVMISYIELSHFWIACGGFKSDIKYIELPILVILFFILFFPLKNMKKNVLVISIPILSLYVLYDIFYYFLVRSARLSDLQNIHTLSDFSYIMSFGVLIIVLISFIAILSIINNQAKNKKIYFIVLIKITMIIGLVYYMSTNAFNDYIFKKFNYLNWSQSKTIKNNGRFSSFIYYGLLSKSYKEKLHLFKNKNIDANKLLFNNLTLKNKKNIYIVILESFIDPRLIQDATFNPSPLSKDMEKYLINKEFSYIKASVYGGGTSQSEFEILTGVPALSKIDSIEFNTLEGNKISGFINLLNKNGYTSNAIIASNSGYYNSKEAYRSLGFNETTFLEESNDFQVERNDKRIFDGDMYKFSLKKLKTKNTKSPYLHYTLGMYGHFPYNRNLLKRPNMIDTTYPDQRIKKIANQFYYRTKALASYVDNILLNDPSSIIFVSSDHLPPLLDNGIIYQKKPLENIALLLVDGQPYNINGLYYYDIPRLIWKLLQDDKKELKTIDKNLYEDIYFKSLSESLQF